MKISKNELPSSLTITGDGLSDMVRYLPYPAHVKDIQSGKYMLSNQENVEIYGMDKVDDIIGMTVHDLDSRMRSRWGITYAKVIDQLDYEVNDKNTTRVDENRVLVNSEGLLRLQTMVKIPAQGFDNKPKAILTFSYDLLDRLNNNDLFQLYLKKYVKKYDAIKYFLIHLNIDEYFYSNQKKDFPSEKQILVMLALAEQRNYKRIAAQLNIAYKTVESHIAKLKEKITSGNLDQMVYRLRRRGHI